MEDALYELARIAETEPKGAKIDLSYLELTSDDLKQLMPAIIALEPSELDLRNNYIEEIPAEMAQLTSLEVLNLNNNRLSTLPDNFGELKSLLKLELNENEFEELPASITGLTNLEVLEVNDNQLESLTPNISKLSNLLALELTGNQFTEITEDLAGLQKLQTLDLSNNQLEVFPENLLALSNLENLYLSSNEITTVSDRISEMSKLFRIDLSENQLTGLPDGMSQLSSLDILSLDNNNIQDLPRSLASAPNLESITLYDNETLTEEAELWLNSVMFGRVEFENASDQVITVAYTDVLNKIYGEGHELQPKIDGLTAKEFRLGSDEDNTKEKISGKEVIETFLKDVPMISSFDQETYGPAAKNLLDKVFQPGVSEEDKNMALTKMASSLGNCPTPVKNLLMQELIVMSKEKKLDPSKSDQLITIFEREAFEEKIMGTLSKQLSEAEKIEQVQALLNSVFLMGAEHSNHNTVLKIEGERERLPSKSANLSTGFAILNDEVAQSFAALCCQTEEDGSLKTENGRYLLDPVKYKEITEPYLAQLGKVSKVAALVNRYETDIKPSIVPDLYLEVGDPDVDKVLDTVAQKNELQALLYKTVSSALQETYTKFLETQKENIQGVVEMLEEAKQEIELPEASVPMQAFFKPQFTQTAMAKGAPVKQAPASFADKYKKQDKDPNKKMKARI